MSEDLSLSEKQAARMSRAISRLEEAISDLDQVFREASVERAQKEFGKGSSNHLPKEIKSGLGYEYHCPYCSSLLRITEDSERATCDDCTYDIATDKMRESDELRFGGDDEE